MYQWRDHCEKKMKKYKYLTAHRATEQSEREDINLKIINKKQNKNILDTQLYKTDHINHDEGDEKMNVKKLHI